MNFELSWVRQRTALATRSSPIGVEHMEVDIWKGEKNKRMKVWANMTLPSLTWNRHIKHLTKLKLLLFHFVCQSAVTSRPFWTIKEWIEIITVDTHLRCVGKKCLLSITEWKTGQNTIQLDTHIHRDSWNSKQKSTGIQHTGIIVCVVLFARQIKCVDVFQSFNRKTDFLLVCLYFRGLQAGISNK